MSLLYPPPEEFTLSARCMCAISVNVVMIAHWRNTDWIIIKCIIVSSPATTLSDGAWMQFYLTRECDQCTIGGWGGGMTQAAENPFISNQLSPLKWMEMTFFKSSIFHFESQKWALFSNRKRTPTTSLNRINIVFSGLYKWLMCKIKTHYYIYFTLFSH